MSLSRKVLTEEAELRRHRDLAEHTRTSAKSMHESAPWNWKWGARG